jgi:AhpD family alkylhydroperoxidase
VTLVRLVDPDTADASVQPMLESGREQYGRVLETWRALLHRPPIFNAYLPYLRAVVGPGVLDRRIKDLAAIRVAIANHCLYSASHRVASARSAGVSEDELAALAEDRLEGFVPRERLAIEFARELTLRPQEVMWRDDRQAIGGELVEALRSTFSDPEIVELTAVVCLWNALTRFHRVMGLALDMPPPPTAIENVV